MTKATKKSIEHKYRETQQVDIEDVRTMVQDYENKIKRLKFLLNDTKRKFDKRYTDLWHNASYAQSYVNRFVHVFSEKPDAIDRDALKDLENYIETHKVYW